MVCEGKVQKAPGDAHSFIPDSKPYMSHGPNGTARQSELVMRDTADQRVSDVSMPHLGGSAIASQQLRLRILVVTMSRVLNNRSTPKYASVTCAAGEDYVAILHMSYPDEACMACPAGECANITEFI